MSVPRWFDAKITAGNLITIAVMLVGFFVWGARLEARVDDYGNKIVKLEAQDAAMTAKIDATRDNASLRQEAVLTRLTRIETILERWDKSGVRP
jgi:outer membrane murein-binding lipoprotein Lpp